MTSKTNDVVRRGGHMIYSATVEQGLVSLDAVADAVVVGVPEGRSFQVMWGCVVLHEAHGELVEADLYDTSRELAEGGTVCQVPDRFVVLDSFPTLRGVVDRAALRRIVSNPFMEPKPFSSKPKPRSVADPGKLPKDDESPTKWYSVGEKTNPNARELMAMERVISSFPPVDRVALVRHSMNEKLEIIWAFVVLRHSHVDIVEESDLHQYARNALIAGQLAHVPDRFVLLDELPSKADGTVDRDQLVARVDRSCNVGTDKDIAKSEDKSAKRSKGFNFKENSSKILSRPEDAVRKYSTEPLTSHPTSPEQKLEKILLASLPGVSEAAVVSVSCTVKYSLLVAWVVVQDEDDETTTEEGLHVHLARAVAEGRVSIDRTPDRFCVVPALPRDGSGRVDREELGRHVRSPFVNVHASPRVKNKNFLVKPSKTKGEKQHDGEKRGSENPKKNKKEKRGDSGTKKNLRGSSLDVLASPLSSKKRSTSPNPQTCKRGASTVSLERVEVRVRELACVQSAAVVVTTTADHEYQMIWAFVTLNLSYREEVGEWDLHEALAKEWPICPDRFIVLQELPRRAGGTVDRTQLMEMVASPFSTLETSQKRTNRKLPWK